MSVSPPNHHPARYSPEVISAFAVELYGCPLAHDPFAGTGERLGSLCDELGVPFSGTELEAAFIRDPRVRQGDSRSLLTYPIIGIEREPTFRFVSPRPHWIVTSPVYANGMADNFKPSGICSRCVGTGRSAAAGVFGPCPPCNATGRREHTYKTYRVAKMKATGDDDAELTEGNMGAHSYRSGRKARERYWTIARACIEQWHRAERVLVNVSDFYLGPELVPHVEEWVSALCDDETGAGFALERVEYIETQRMRYGQNHARRAPSEALIVAKP